MSVAGYLVNQRNIYNPDIEEPVERILNDFCEALKYHRSLSYYEPSPLESLPVLAHQLGLGNILVKNEGLRFGTSAFKILGVSFAIHKIIEQNPAVKGICTATDGNNGHTVAWWAKRKNLEVVIFVPHFTPTSRIRYIENEGATVYVSPGDFNATLHDAKNYAQTNGFALVQDSSWEENKEIAALITAGYYTQMHEVFAQTNGIKNPGIDVIFIQAGVGSWPSAVVHFLRKFKRNESVKIVCVEPCKSGVIYESVKRSTQAVARKSQETSMTVPNPGTPSSPAFEILKNGADAFEVIADTYTIDAIKYFNAPLPGDPYIAAGESGSAGLAGLLGVMNNHSISALRRYLNLNEKSNVLLFNTENVTDPVLLEKMAGTDAV